MTARLRIAAFGVVLALLVGIGIYRIPPVDIPWHLATGRFILENQTFPVTNTFSWTHPDHTLNQQYPLFQVALALIVDHVGWSWVTLANALGWALGVLAWMRWAGPLKDAAQQPLLWLVVVLGVQRHHVPRPELLTVLGLGLILLGLDALREADRGTDPRGSSRGPPRGRQWAAGLAVVAAQWMMVNSHQMWSLGIALQVGTLVHLGIVRWAAGRWGDRGWVATEDRELPVAPFLATLAGSVAVLALSPLGLRIYLAPLATLDTVLSQGAGAEGGAQARELMPVWEDPLALLVVVTVFAAVVGWLARSRRVVPFDWFVAAMGFGLVALAVRGAPFAALAGGAVAARARARSEPLLPPESPVHGAAAVATVLIAARLLFTLQTAPLAFYRTQPGVGRTVGEWQDRAIAFLRADPPPGELLNVGWVAGNPLIGGLYPVRRVFVDPRWEAYPRDFLLESIAASSDPDRFARLLDRWRPGFVVLEVPDPDARARLGDLLARGDWRLVYADHLLAVAVHEDPAAADWLARHPPLDPATWDPGEWAEDHPVLLAEQQIRTASLLRLLGQPMRAERLLERARVMADHPIVAAKLSDLDPTSE